MNGKIINFTCIVLCMAASACGDELILESINGTSHRPFSGDKPAKAVVLIFTATDCPVANYFQPTIQRLSDRFDGKGVDFFQIYPDRDTNVASARKHADEYKIATPQVLDPDQKLAKGAGAKKTPEAIVYNTKGEVVYRGRIDDTYAALGKKRAKPTTADLEVAIESVLTGKKLKTEITEPIGCFIFFEKTSE